MPRGSGPLPKPNARRRNKRVVTGTVTASAPTMPAAQTVKWTAGGAPADAAKGIALTAGAAAPAAPAPAKTGDAGLLGTSGTSMALVLMLGIAAAALVAGARTATRGR